MSEGGPQDVKEFSPGGAFITTFASGFQNLTLMAFGPVAPSALTGISGTPATLDGPFEVSAFIDPPGTQVVNITEEIRIVAFTYCLLNVG